MNIKTCKKNYVIFEHNYSNITKHTSNSISIESNMIKNSYVIFQQKKKNILKNKNTTVYIKIKKNNENLFFFHNNTSKEKKYQIKLLNLFLYIEKNSTLHLTETFLNSNEKNTIIYMNTIIIFDENTQTKYYEIHNYNVIKTNIFIKKNITLNNNSTLDKFLISIKDTFLSINTHVNIRKNAIFNFYIASKTKMTSHNYKIKVIHLDELSKSNILTHCVLLNIAKILEHIEINIYRAGKNVQAHILCKALLLTKTTKCIFKPYLKIYNNEIICTHGASIGKINKETLHYMLSRGLEQQKAIKIIINAFFSIIFSLINNKNIYEYTVMESTK